MLDSTFLKFKEVLFCVEYRRELQQKVYKYKGRRSSIVKIIFKLYSGKIYKRTEWHTMTLSDTHVCSTSSLESKISLPFSLW